uniref:Uncharacterized protein n=1 Tax=Rhizophora mucronata TaxID=61149 RepID=A0A2P2Q9M8_RHIMU
MDILPSGLVVHRTSVVPSGLGYAKSWWVHIDTVTDLCLGIKSHLSISLVDQPLGPP